MNDPAVSAEHTLVWIDHNEARIFDFDRELTPAGHRTVKSPQAPVHLHHKANERRSGHLPVDHSYLEQVAVAVSGAALLLITGPANAKHELVAHIADCHPGMAQRIVGIETLDHPHDGELQNFARKFFRRADRMTRLGVRLKPA